MQLDEYFEIREISGVFGSVGYRCSQAQLGGNDIACVDARNFADRLLQSTGDRAHTP